MNGYERIKSALDGVMPDVRPVMLHNFLSAAEMSGVNMKHYREDPYIAAHCLIDSVERYNLDGVLFDVDTALLASAIGVPTDYPDDEPARTYAPLLTDISEVFVLEDIDISSNRRVQHATETVRILKSYFKDEVYVRGNCDQSPFSLATMIRTPELFLMDLIIDPENSLKLLDYTTGVTKQMIRLMSESGADMLSNGDSPAGPDMISPEMYRKFAFPYEKAVCDYSHECGKPYLLHICGKTDLILDDMSRIGLDAVELDYKTSIDSIFDTMHSSCTLFGTVDPSGIIALGTEKDVESKTIELLRRYDGCARLVVNAGCAIPRCAPDRNIRKFVETVHNWSL